MATPRNPVAPEVVARIEIRVREGDAWDLHTEHLVLEQTIATLEGVAGTLRAQLEETKRKAGLTQPKPTPPPLRSIRDGEPLAIEDPKTGKVVEVRV